EAIRVARRFVIVSVPSTPDNNPEHVQLFTGATLARVLREAGAANVRVEYVVWLEPHHRRRSPMSAIHKFLRTRHILDSGLQPGDEDLGRAGFEEIAGWHLVVEEKVDGANAAISFDTDGRLLLHSRGHYLTGGPRELHFSHFKPWAHGLHSGLWKALDP